MVMEVLIVVMENIGIVKSIFLFVYVSMFVC